MRHAHSWFATLLVFLTIACSPVVTTHTKAPGVHISGESISEGKHRIVKVTIAPKKEGTPGYIVTKETVVFVMKNLGIM